MDHKPASGTAGSRTRIFCLQDRRRDHLDHAPREWNRRELHPDFSHARRVSSCWTTDPFRARNGECGTRNEDQLVPFRIPTSEFHVRSDQGGSRTHKRQALDLTAIPVRVLGRSRRPRSRTWSPRLSDAARTPLAGGQLRTWESNPACGLMRPTWTPVRPQSSYTPRTRTRQPRS